MRIGIQPLQRLQIIRDGKTLTARAPSHLGRQLQPAMHDVLARPALHPNAQAHGANLPAGDSPVTSVAEPHWTEPLQRPLLFRSITNISVMGLALAPDLQDGQLYVSL